MLSFVSSKARGWTKGSLVIALMTDTGLGMNSNCLTTTGDETSPTSDSYNFGTLGDLWVDGFFGGIVPAINKKKSPLKCIQSSVGWGYIKWSVNK